MVRLVLFDIDGTLLHSAGCGRAATRLALQEVFGTIGKLDTLSFAGKTDWQILLELLEPEGFSAEDVQAQLEAHGESVARHLIDVITQYPISPCIGAHEVVAALRNNPDVTIGLVTGNMASIVSTKLTAAGFDPADFKIGAFGSEGWDRSMLPPLALQRAKAYSKIDFSGDQIVIIGDTPGDIQCAASIRARTLAVATGPFSVTQLQPFQPTYVFESMADWQAVVSAILNDGQ
jgi:phosphoglycolate phosphatase-like HAD superfamily hydrolase